LKEKIKVNEDENCLTSALMFFTFLDSGDTARKLRSWFKP